MLEVRLSQPVPREFQPEIVKNLYWVDAGIEAFTFDPDDGQRLLCRYAGPAPSGLEDRVRASAEKLIRCLEAMPAKIAFEVIPTASGQAGTPYGQLVKRGWLKPSAGGTHQYSGLFLEMFQALDLQFRREAYRLEAEEHKFPALLPLPVLAASGYLASFPHHANFVCHLPEQAEAIEDFRARLKAKASAAGAAVDACCVTGGGSVDPEGTALAPTVCYHFFQRHAGLVLAPGQLLAATAQGSCFRFEGRAMRELHRLREFNMREIMVLGAPGAVQSWRTLLLEAQRRVLERCQLRATVRTASDPFFIDDYDKKRIFQLSFDLKYEVQAWLPNTDETLAIGSVNQHQDYFGVAFNIRLSTGQPAHSACLGFGLDRWCLAVFAQHGLDPDQWPPTLQSVLAEHRALIRSLRGTPGRLHP